MSEHRIVLERDGDGFAVRVQPPLDGHDLDRTSESYKDARGWAGGLRLTHCWPIDDHAADEWEPRS